MPTQPITIAIDPATRSGIALFIGAELRFIDSVSCDPLEIHAKHRALTRALTAAKVPITASGVVVGAQVRMVVEKQFLGHASSLSVVKSATVWKAIGKLCNCQLLPGVLPSQWQKTYGLSKGASDSRYADGATLLRKHLPDALANSGSDIKDLVAATLLGIHQQMELVPELAAEFGWVRAEREARMPDRRRKRTK